MFFSFFNIFIDVDVVIVLLLLFALLSSKSSLLFYISFCNILSRVGTNYLYTVAHEIGHALGMAHAADKTSLMFPYDKGYIPDLKLPADDIYGVQLLYGNSNCSIMTDPMGLTGTKIISAPQRPLSMTSHS